MYGLFVQLFSTSFYIEFSAKTLSESQESSEENKGLAIYVNLT